MSAKTLGDLFKGRVGRIRSGGRGASSAKGRELFEGQLERVAPEQEEVIRLSPEERAELEAALAEADHVEGITSEELLARLRRFG